MATQKTNFVDEVLANAKVSMASTIGSVSKPGALQAYAKDCVANADLISQVANAAGVASGNKNDSPQNSKPGSVSLDIKTPSMMGSVMGAGVVLGLSVVNPLMGAGAAAVMAVGEAVTFATGHAGVKGSTPQGGELTMAAADKKSYAESNPSSYTDILGDTYHVESGQKQQSVAPAQPVNSRIADAVQDVSKDYSQEQIAGDVRTMMDTQMKNYAWAQNKLEMLGGKDVNTSPEFDMEGLNLDKPKPVIAAAPKALAFG